MLQQALQKLHKEVGEKEKEAYVKHVGAFLIDYVKSHQEHAAFILTEDKTITGSLTAMKEEARKNQKNGVGVLTDEEGFKFVLKYFEIPVQGKSRAVATPELNITSIDDLL